MISPSRRCLLATAEQALEASCDSRLDELRLILDREFATCHKFYTLEFPSR
jgi:hypothetical protein